MNSTLLSCSDLFAFGIGKMKNKIVPTQFHFSWNRRKPYLAAFIIFQVRPQYYARRHDRWIR